MLVYIELYVLNMCIVYILLRYFRMCMIMFYIHIRSYWLHNTFETNACKITGWLPRTNYRHTMIYILLPRSWVMVFILY